MLNEYAIAVLVALLGEYALGVLADVLNLRNLSSELPPELRERLDPAAYRRSQQYTRARTRLGLVSSTVSLAALLIFWFAGGFAELDRLVRGLGLGPVWTGLAFLGALALLVGLLGLPFAVVSTFVVEERFGFNRTTPATFVLDRLKAVLLAVVLGGPLLAAVLWLLQTAGPYGWLYGWAVVTAFILLVQLVAPSWIMPLFNRFAPLDDPALKDAIMAYARSVEFPLSQVFVMDGSKRSSKANAFFTGLGKRRRVALFDTLIDKHPTEEVVAVLAHEVGHYRKGHVTRSLVIAIAHAGVMFALLSLVLELHGLYAAFGLAEPSVYAGLVLFGLLYTPAEVALALLLNALSRRQERQADRFAARTTGSGEALARALERLAADSLSNLTPHRLYVTLHHAHPPVLERIRALRAR
ncbi:MAG: M48 family metallopeptidase [Deltaproteobacteria bacterium]|nr:M48 family metallopeptidase [Deltaproteobacteria bacterium]MBW2535780.1 M48 family metallopeptidase [Deltaproteobacteria bacterium]